MIDKKKLIEELLDCVADATDAETKITSLTMAGLLMDEVIEEALTTPDVGVSLPKQIVIDEIDKRIDRLYKHSEKVKGAEKKSYEDTCTSFVLFKMWLQQQ